MQSLSGQVALVTGASSGIGRAIALAVAAEGACVYALGRDQQRLSSVVESSGPGGGHMVPVRIDLTRDDEIQEFADRIKRDHKGVDILVHSAGEHVLGRLEDVSVDKLDSLYRANVRGPYRLTQCTLPALKAVAGQIVFINSSTGVSAPAGAGQFAATMHATKALADSLRQEVNADGVRIMNVFLGRVATPRQERIYAKEGKGYQPGLLLQPEDVAKLVVTALGLPKTAEVTELRMRPAIKSY